MSLFFRLLASVLVVFASDVSAQNGRYTFAGPVTSVQNIPGGVELTLDQGKVRIEHLPQIGFRVRHSWTGTFEPLFSYAVVEPAPAAGNVQVKDEADQVTVTGGDEVLVVAKRPFRLTFQNAAGEHWFRESFGAGHTYGRWAHVLQRHEDEQYFGLGGKASELNRTGRRFEQWNTDVAEYRFNEEPLYASFPFFYGLRNGRAWGIFYDNSWRSTVDFGSSLRGHVGVYGDGGELRYYVFSGPSMASVLEKYTRLTGRTPLPPMWALGYHQSRKTYLPESELYRMAEEFRKREIPLDALHIDVDHADSFRAFTWSPQHFPNAAAVIGELGQRGIRIVESLDPGVRDDAEFDVRSQGTDGGFFVKLPDGSPYGGETWGGRSLFPDFSSPATRTWWGELHQRSLDLGVAGIWTSMNEPSVFGGRTMPDLAEFDKDGQGAGHLEMHNVYGLLMARSSYEGLAKLRPESRPFVMSRSGFAGVQRYATLWTGENSADWDHVYLGLPMVMGLGLAGVPFAGFDIGGYNGEPSGEMFARSMQIGAMMPFSRAHTEPESARQEPWSYGPEYERINRAFLRMRYKLLPTIYSAFYQHTKTGAPVVRPLVWNWQQDANVLQIDDQFLLGDHLMFAPVIKEGQSERSVYLPAGLWYKYHSREKIQGGRRIIESAPSRPGTSDADALRAMPVYARAGAIIPEQEAMEYVGQAPVKEMELQIFAGGNLTSVLYEDDGKTNAYRRGEFRALTFSTEAYSGGFKIKATQEGSYQGGAVRFSYMIHGLDRKPDRITVNGRNIVYFYERTTNTIVFKIAAGATDIHVIYQ